MCPTLSTEDPSSNGSSNRGLFFSHNEMWRGAGCWHWFSDSAIPRSLIFRPFSHGNKIWPLQIKEICPYSDRKRAEESRAFHIWFFSHKSKTFSTNPKIYVHLLATTYKINTSAQRKVGKWNCKPFQAFQ